MIPIKNRRWLVAPGTLCTPAVFDPMLDALGVAASQRAALTLDQADMAAYRRKLPSLIEPGDIICGFSLGSIVCAHCADLLDGAHAIILFGINPHADDPTKKQGRLAFRDQIAADGPHSVIGQNPPALHGPFKDTALASIIDMATINQPLLPAQTDLALTRPGALPALAQAAAPVVALNGDKDTMTPLDNGQAAADAAPHGLMVTLHGLGHYALLEDPQSCADAVQKALGALGRNAP